MIISTVLALLLATMVSGLAAQPKTTPTAGIGIFQVEHGKVTRAWLITDRLGFLQEIGALPKPPSSK